MWEYIFLGVLVLAIVGILIYILYINLKGTTNQPVIPPSPPPSPPPDNTQTADLRITNSSGMDLWFEMRGTYPLTTADVTCPLQTGAPIPFKTINGVTQTTENTQTTFLIKNGSYMDLDMPDEGIAGTRFWAKYGCDSNGTNCKIGDQMQYWNPTGAEGANGPGTCVGIGSATGGCPTTGCTPPVDSLFEATWGCKLSNPNECSINPTNPPNINNLLGPTTYFDTSQVDGYTFPYKLLIKGDLTKCSSNSGQPVPSVIDASGLSLAQCPKNENLTNSPSGQWSSTLCCLQRAADGTCTQYSQDTYGAYPDVVDCTLSPPAQYNLSSVDLSMRNISDGKIYGCMSPCKKLTYGQPYGFLQDEGGNPSIYYCCPTPDPNNCVINQGCITSSECSSGPIVNTQYVTNVRKMTNNQVYTYAYDDSLGLNSCPAGEIQYEFVILPPPTSYPYSG